MAREYNHDYDYDYYMQINDLQPVMHYNPYEMTPAAPPYEMTVDPCVGAVPGGTMMATHMPIHQSTSVPYTEHQYYDPHRRNGTQYAESFDMANCETPMATSSAQVFGAPASATRKRKPSSFGTCSTFDDDGTDDSRSTRTLPEKKQNHSEIEKRRRDKMNTYIAELSAMIPMCGAMSRKLDKLTVLRMAVQHMRTVRGAQTAGPLTAQPRPAFLSERELNALVLNAAKDAFLLVVGCDRGRLLYVSASVSHMLHCDQSELLGQSLFDILHPKDVAKVKEQLSSPDLSPRERFIDAKTMLPVKSDFVAGASRLCTGARRSFFCRIKCRAVNNPPEGASSTVTSTSTQVKEETEGTAKIRKKHNEKKYCVVQCTGYLKSWAPMELESEGFSSGDVGDDGENSNLTCLVAVGRALSNLAPVVHTPPMPPARCLQYISRHATDGKFLFVDQRVTLALGFLPQELLGTSLYEYVSAPDLGVVAYTHKAALLQREALHTPPYSFRRKDGTMARITTNFKPFKNPWTKDVEYLVANNTIVTDSYTSPQHDSNAYAYDIYKQNKAEEDATYEYDIADALSEGDAEMQRLIDSQVESYKIGCAIAEEALRRSSPDYICDLPVDLIQDVVFNQQSSLVDNILEMDLGDYSDIRNNVNLSEAGGEVTPPPTASTEDFSATSPNPASPLRPPLGTDGNGEATMAVIMSLLEADAGLGGPVNFSGLPWPLP